MHVGATSMKYLPKALGEDRKEKQTSYWCIKNSNPMLIVLLRGLMEGYIFLSGLDTNLNLGYDLV